MPYVHRDPSRGLVWAPKVDSPLHVYGDDLPVPFSVTPWTLLRSASFSALVLYVFLPLATLVTAALVPAALSNATFACGVLLLATIALKNSVYWLTAAKLSGSRLAAAFLALTLPTYVVILLALPLATAVLGSILDASLLVIAAVAVFHFVSTRFAIRPVAASASNTVRGEGLVDEKEAKRRVDKESRRSVHKFRIPWGTAGLPFNAATLHFLLLGSPGAGKTVLLKGVLQWLLRTVLPALPDNRILLYDFRQEYFPFLLGVAGDSVPIVNLHPFEERGYAWAIAKDIADQADAEQLAATVIPDIARQEPFYANAARDLLAGVVVSFIENSPSEWTLRDVVLACTHRVRLRAVLARSAYSRDIADEAFENPKLAHSVRYELKNAVRPFSSVASAWHRSGAKTYSLEQWSRESAVLVLGNQKKHGQPLRTINRLLFSRISEILVDGPEVAGDNPRRTWLFMDELKALGRIEGFSELLTNGRGRGVCVLMGFQDVSGLRVAYGADESEEVSGLASNQFIGRLEDDASAEWASDAFHKPMKQFFDTTRSSDDDGISVGVKHSVEANVIPAEFRALPVTSARNGLHGYFRSVVTGGYRGTVPGKEIPTLSPRFDDIEAFERRAPKLQTLLPWDEDDLKRLGLPLELLNAESEEPDEPEPSASEEDEPDEGGSSPGLGGIKR